MRILKNKKGMSSVEIIFELVAIFMLMIMIFIFKDEILSSLNDKNVEASETAIENKSQINAIEENKRSDLMINK